VNEVLVLGILIGIFLGIAIDRLVLKATLLPWLLSHGWR